MRGAQVADESLAHDSIVPRSFRFKFGSEHLLLAVLADERSCSLGGTVRLSTLCYFLLCTLSTLFLRTHCFECMLQHD